MRETQTVKGTIKHVGCARIEGNDHFSIVLEEQPFMIYSGNKNPRLAVAREGQYVELRVEILTADVKLIQGFGLLPKPE